MHDKRIHVRHATEHDLDDLTAITVQVQNLHSEGRPDLFRAADPDALRGYLAGRIATGWIVLVAEHPELGLSGFLLAELIERPESPFQFKSTSVYVHQIAVEEQARRMPIGDVLLNEITERARHAGSRSIRLDSWYFDTDAHRFFEAHGFTPMRLIFEHRLDDEVQPSS